MYRAVFDQQHVAREQMSAVFQEYAWDMGWCDPCAADPLSADELRRLGVWWVGNDASGGADVFLTRLHVRYDGAHFPQDLVFQQTGDRQNFQGRYVMRHPWTGTETCSEADTYRRSLVTRREQEAQTLASLTGWDINEIRRRQGAGPRAAVDNRPWWERLW